MLLIGEVGNSSRERALVAQRLETGFLTVRLRVQFPPGSVGAHCWRVPNRTKRLSSAPASFRLSTLLINDEFLIEYSACFHQDGAPDRRKIKILAIGKTWTKRSQDNFKKWNECQTVQLVLYQFSVQGFAETENVIIYFITSINLD